MVTTELREAPKSNAYVDSKEVCHETIHDSDDRGRVLDTVEHCMRDLDYPDADVFAMHLTLAEAIDNAVKHGHQGDWSRPVKVRFFVDDAYVVAQVEDQGKGFDPKVVPDPRAPENITRSSGRGVLLMQTYMTWMRYNPRGNCVTLYLRRSS